jgi:hypothetical protein
MSPNAWGGGELRALSQWGTAVHKSPINFGDLTPYLTYVNNHRKNTELGDVLKEIQQFSLECDYYFIRKLTLL